MIDREEVIRELQYDLEKAEKDGSLYVKIHMIRPIISDIINMLKEQKAVELKRSDILASLEEDIELLGDSAEERKTKGDISNLLKEQEIKPYRFKRVQATYVGMNFETGELKHYNVYECPHCGDEVTKSMAQEWKYCPNCGKAVKWDD